MKRLDDVVFPMCVGMNRTIYSVMIPLYVCSPCVWG